jgi:AcrR family transcriptional regulator
MGRRSDHTRAELEMMLIDEGHRQLEAVGLAKFSARDVAKQVGYSIGSLYNVFGSYDGLMMAINGRTLKLWAAHLRGRLAEESDDRIACLVHGYFEFAAAHPKTWIAIFEHHMDEGIEIPAWYKTVAFELMSIVVDEIVAAISDLDPVRAPPLARSLVATVHGHCAFAFYKTFEVLGEEAPVEAALRRVRESIHAATA